MSSVNLVRNSRVHVRGCDLIKTPVSGHLGGDAVPRACWLLACKSYQVAFPGRSFRGMENVWDRMIRSTKLGVGD